jgi:hypothetical protein
VGRYQVLIVPAVGQWETKTTSLNTYSPPSHDGMRYYYTLKSRLDIGESCC